MERIIIALVFCSLGLVSGQVNSGSDPSADDRQKSLNEVSLVTTMLDMIVKDLVRDVADCKRDIASLNKTVTSLKAHAHVEPSFTETIECIKPNDTLQEGDNGRFFKRIQVEFKTPYEFPPEVITSTETLKMKEGVAVRFEQRVVKGSVTNNSFQVECAAWGKDEVKEATVRYLSVPQGF